MSSYDIELERTDEAPKTQYLTKKDVIRVGFAIAFLAIIMYPAYILLKGNAENHVCSTNFHNMFVAIGLYSEENNGRLPPVYMTSETDAPYIENGAAYTWVHLVDGYVKNPEDFTCPTADKTAGVRAHASTGGSVPLTYGMYAPLGGEPKDQIDNPDNVVLLGETANMGSGKTYDPLPFKDAQGNVVPYDAFVIGFDNSNLLPDPKSKFLTRLAYDDSAGGVFKLKGPSRHRDGIHFLTVSGRLKTVGPQAALYLDENGNVNPMWQLPKGRRFRR